MEKETAPIKYGDVVFKEHRNYNIASGSIVGNTDMVQS